MSKWLLKLSVLELGIAPCHYEAKNETTWQLTLMLTPSHANAVLSSVVVLSLSLSLSLLSLQYHSVLKL